MDRAENAPNLEFPGPPEGLEKRREKNVEQRPPTKEDTGNQVAPQQGVVVPTIAPAPVVVPQTPPAGQKSVSGQQIIPALPADDTDLIEKHWVDTAKMIVEETRDDPHQQKTKISQAGVKYKEQRFNRTIKTNTPGQT